VPISRRAAAQLTGLESSDAESGHGAWPLELIQWVPASHIKAIASQAVVTLSAPHGQPQRTLKERAAKL
jgi:hypothetical protein